jgi:hypothetical protein
MMEYEEEFLHREDLIFKYRYCHSYAPIHPLWLIYESQYTLKHAGKVIFAGVPSKENFLAPPQVEGEGPGTVRSMGVTPARDFDEAWKMAEKIVGKNPVVVACPEIQTKPRMRFYIK